MSDKKKVSFKDIQSRFLDLNDKEALNPSTENDSTANKKLDSSFFDFDSRDPNAILIAGSSNDSGSTGGSSACKSCGATGDGGCGASAGCCGDSGCDAGGASDGGSCE